MWDVISRDDARKLVEAHLASPDIIVSEQPIVEGDFGWVFGYQSEAFVRTRDVRHALAGNGPILVERVAGRLIAFGSAMPVEFYLENYLVHGDPYLTAGQVVRLVAFSNTTSRLDIIKLVRSRTGFSVAQAKTVVDACEARQNPEIECQSTQAAAELVKAIVALGGNAVQVGLPLDEVR